ncbi:hypothetical protein FRB97_004625 [Tulasnella sp. 331]|nr:hypothetical protein FRB98_008533 [Tulasnella sp. 332]KAG8875919.1 hypothetical protein FRB97_004625 [Tulasnella sp. 331]
MANISGRHQLTVGVVPPGATDKILVSIYSKNLTPTDWRAIAAASTQDEDLSIPGDGFVGVVVTVGRNVRDKGFAVGDAVAGSVNVGSWVEGSNQGQPRPASAAEQEKEELTPHLDLIQVEYLSIKPDSLWHLSPEVARRFQIISPSGESGCVIV